jgi:hypothetical protein
LIERRLLDAPSGSHCVLATSPTLRVGVETILSTSVLAIRLPNAKMALRRTT